MAGKPCTVGIAAAAAVTAPAAFNKSRRDRSLFSAIGSTPQKGISSELYHVDLEGLMRVLILGGTGLTGPFVARRLDGLGHEVTVFHRGEHEAQMPDGVRHIHGDFAHPPVDLRQLAPDVVVLMRAMTEADAKEFLEVFRGSAGRAVAISSGDVYAAYGRLLRLDSGPPGDLPIAEDAPLRESRYPYCRPGSLPGDWKNWYDKVLVEQTLRAQSEIPEISQSPKMLPCGSPGTLIAGREACPATGRIGTTRSWWSRLFARSPRSL